MPQEKNKSQTERTSGEILNNLSSLHLYYPTGETKGQFASNALHISQAVKLGWATVVDGPQNSQYIIVPQTVKGKDGVAQRTSLIGKGDIQNVKIPKHTLLPECPCTQCGGSIEPILNAQKASVINCNYCDSTNPAQWTTEVREQMVQLLNPWRVFDDPVEGNVKDVAKIFRPTLQLPFTTSQLENEILAYDTGEGVSVYKIENTSRRDLEELVAISFGQTQTDGPSVTIAEQSGTHTTAHQGKQKLRPVKEVMQHQADLEHHRLIEAELRIADQLHTLLTILNDTTGKFNPVHSKNSFLDELKIIHEEYTRSGNDHYEVVSSIRLNDERVSIQSVFDRYQSHMKGENHLFFYQYETIALMINPRTTKTLEQRRYIARLIAKTGINDLQLPANPQDKKRMDALMEAMTKEYEEVLGQQWIGGWSCHDEAYVYIK